MAVTLRLGTRMPMARGHRRIRAPAVIRLGGRCPVDAVTRSGNEVHTHSTHSNIEAHYLFLDDSGAHNKGAEAFTGPGGNASGGSVFGNGGLIDLFSGVYRAPLRGLDCPPSISSFARQWW